MRSGFCDESLGVVVIGEEARRRFKRPLGRLYRPDELAHLLSEVKKGLGGGARLITVGDRVTEFFLGAGLRPKLSIIDRREKRGKFGRTRVEEFDRLVVVRNDAGTINFRLCPLIREALESPGSTVFLVVGEEDLTAAAAILAADEGDYVAYGQPGEGVVLCSVSTSLINTVASILGLTG
ncbi:hypothetical protein B6U99_00825 [Candidatus Geothermarchaeota archaeon ex4572_27]|nr:MAG: hypothetical protein B6U99_00825 [Candidatus Geothermarchaeota archaeon ex4572_27]